MRSLIMGRWRQQHLGDEPRRKKNRHTGGDLEGARALRAGAAAGWEGCVQLCGHVRCAAPAWTTFSCGYSLVKELRLPIVQSINGTNVKNIDVKQLFLIKPL